MKKKHLNIIICGIIGLVIGLSGLLYDQFKEDPHISALHKLELGTIDNRTFLRYKYFNNNEDSKVVIIAFDELTRNSKIKELEKHPLPRSIYASLIKKLNDLGIKVIGIDLMFSGKPDLKNSQDKALIDTLKKYKNVILAQKFNLNAGIDSINVQTSFDNYFSDDRYAFVNVDPDIDGSVRRFKYKGIPFQFVNMQTMTEETKYLESFAVKLINQYQPDLVTEKQIKSSDSEKYFINYSLNQYENAILPLYLFFVNKQEAQDEIQKFNLKDKIAIIADTTATGSDYYSSPIGLSLPDTVGSGIPGAYVHASVINSVLSNQVLKNFDPVVNNVILILLCILLAVILSLANKFWKAILAIILLIAGYILFSYYMFIYQNQITDVVFPVIQLFLTGTFSWAYVYFAVNKEKDYIYSSFRKYVSPEIAKIAAENIENLSAKRTEVTLLFSDIADFTTISEQMDPPVLAKMLNTYLTEMGKVVFQYNGTLDKYIGDAIMAFWGAPLPIKNSEINACKAALEMQKVIATLNEQFGQEGLPNFRTRIGVNTAEVMVGNLGGDLFNYTAIGDGVNLASRLEGANKSFNTSIIISENTYLKVKDAVLARELGSIKVKGKTQEVTVFELVGTRADNPDLITDVNIFTQAVEYFKNNQLDQAEDSFKILANKNPEDFICQSYLDKIRNLKG